MNKNTWKYLVDSFLFISLFGLAVIGILMAFFLAEGPTVNDEGKYFLGLHRHQWGDIHLILSLTFIALIIIHLILEWSWVKAQSRRLFKNKAPLIISITVAASFFTIFVFWVFMPKNSPSYSNYGRRYGDFGRLGIAQQSVQPATSIPAPTSSPALTPSGAEQQKRESAPNKVSEKSLSETPADQQRPKKEIEGKLETTSALPPHEEIHEHEDKLVHGRLEEDTSGIVITGQMCLRDIELKTGISSRTIIQAMGLPANVSELDNLGRLRKKYGFSIQELRDFITAELQKRQKK
ncbi:MAG: DUF4405 domain-containing protein [Candidatus Aminicenantes bacterium]|nr:DUF4405 domain-containing protein [Candidatus Aminicenantes bacterium]